MQNVRKHWFVITVETNSLVSALNDIIADITEGNFIIEDSFEDVHSKIEYLLTVN
jgi:argininosuccinate lyase